MKEVWTVCPFSDGKTAKLVQCVPGYAYIRFEVYTAVTMKNGVFRNVNAVWLL
jgi:hypothetical protein